ncbi:hypothetical protein EMCRGX_G011142 [Ephydatia muelleri]
MSRGAEDKLPAFILRLPVDHAQRVREAITSDSLGERVQLEFYDDLRHAHVKFDEEILNGKLVDLPCIIESHKTLDRKTLYKAGDISQMLVCTTEPIEEPVENIEELPLARRKELLKRYVWNHGISIPLKNVRKRRFRKTANKKFIDSPETEKEVHRLLREDLLAVKVIVMEEEKEEEKADDARSFVSEGDTMASSRTVTPYVLDEVSSSSDDDGEGDSEEEELQVAHEDSDNENHGPNSPSAAILSAIQDLESQIEEQKHKIQTTSNHLLRERFEVFLGELERQKKSKLEELRAIQS